MWVAGGDGNEGRKRVEGEGRDLETGEGMRKCLISRGGIVASDFRRVELAVIRTEKAEATSMMEARRI